MDFVDIVRRDTCDNGNDYNGMMGARISSVFVILVGSGFGAFFPIVASRYSFIRMPSWVFFVCKYFGSGVIVATAFIHLLQPANENLSDDCLGSGWGDYPYAFGICLVTLFILFFFELCAFHFVESKTGGSQHSHSHFGELDAYVKKDLVESEDDSAAEDSAKPDAEAQLYPKHFSHAADHQDREVMGTLVEDDSKEKYYGQLVSVFVLEFGVIFHSVFVGLTLAVSGEEFKTLYVVIVFHQLFEGLGLGSRIASTVWPPHRRATPWFMALGYALTTPIAIAIGLGVRTSYPPNSARALITNGIFDSISAGILVYTGLVELMAHEFLFSNEFLGPKGFSRMLYAYLTMCVGCGVMALLGRWA